MPHSITCGTATRGGRDINIAVIFAGGSGQRMRSSAVPKQFLDFNGKPLIIHTLEHFEHHRDIDAIAIACIADWIDTLRGHLEHYGIRKVRWIVEGGSTGQMSIYNALAAVEPDAEPDDVVLVHDGVRPIIDGDMISRNIESARDLGSAVTVFPAYETPILSQSGKTVDQVLPRAEVFIAQAPQSFRLGELLACHRKAQAEGRIDHIDSCSLFRESHEMVHLVAGSRSNIKVTTPEDFYVFRALSEFAAQREIDGV